MNIWTVLHVLTEFSNATQWIFVLSLLSLLSFIVFYSQVYQLCVIFALKINALVIPAIDI